MLKDVPVIPGDVKGCSRAVKGHFNGAGRRYMDVMICDVPKVLEDVPRIPVNVLRDSEDRSRRWCRKNQGCRDSVDRSRRCQSCRRMSQGALKMLLRAEERSRRHPRKVPSAAQKSGLIIRSHNLLSVQQMFKLQAMNLHTHAPDFPYSWARACKFMGLQFKHLLNCR